MASRSAAQSLLEEGESFIGSVEHVIFQNAENGYAILRVMPDKGSAGLPAAFRSGVTCVGTLPSPQGGMKFRFTGQWVNNAKYGRQFAFTGAEEQIPVSDAGLIAYLSSGLIKGVGAELARRIVNHFGKETVDVLDNTPDRLLDIRGIAPKTLEGIKKTWVQHRNMSNLMQTLQPHGISPAYAMRIYNAYGANALTIVTENPYRLAMDIRGIGFTTADAIAGKLGVARDSSLRIEAGILYVLQQASEQGDVFLPMTELTQRAVSYLDVPQELVNAAYVALVEDHERIVLEAMDDELNTEGKPETAIYLKFYYTCESKTAYYLDRLKRMPHNVYFTDVDRRLVGILGQLPFQLAQAQLEAVRKAAKSKVMVLTGGPGTGKTTIIKAIISLFEQKTKRILLAAPTGRAAKRMAEATGRDARTLHRLLEFNPVEAEFGRNEDRPLACDLLIVDEASMMDIVLFYHLLKAAPTGATIIFVGDIYQLPSVGPGSVLSDIISSHVIPVAELNEIFRQGAKSDIVLNAHLINEGTMPSLVPPQDHETDFYFMNEDDAEKVADLVVDLVSRRLPSHYKLDPVRDIQVLSPMHKGGAGAINLNVRLQEALNPNGVELRRGERVFRQGDKVMQIRNNYEQDVFNGDIGSITRIDVRSRTLTVRFDDKTVEYESASLDELVPAYAISIHKSQGSEYPAVIIPLLMQHYIMLQRNLVYTGITRGKRLVVLVGEQRALARAVKNNNPVHRFTRLSHRLKNSV